MKKTMILLGLLVLSISLIACGNEAVNNKNVANNSEAVEATDTVEENTDTEPAAETSDESSGDELSVGKIIPNYEWTTLEGETVSLHDYQGKILILNFWTTW
jgi:hypothetical protein